MDNNTEKQRPYKRFLNKLEIYIENDLEKQTVQRIFLTKLKIFTELHFLKK